MAMPATSPAATASHGNDGVSGGGERNDGGGTDRTRALNGSGRIGEIAAIEAGSAGAGDTAAGTGTSFRTISRSCGAGSRAGSRAISGAGSRGPSLLKFERAAGSTGSTATGSVGMGVGGAGSATGGMIGRSAIGGTLGSTGGVFESSAENAGALSTGAGPGRSSKGAGA